MSATRTIGTATLSAGTPGFQSPEQLKAEGVGIASDVFALGGVLTELFGGNPLWGSLTSHAIMFKIAVEGKMPNVSHLPTPIRHVVEHCLCPIDVRKDIAVILQMFLDCE